MDECLIPAPKKMREHRGTRTSNSNSAGDQRMTNGSITMKAMTARCFFAGGGCELRIAINKLKAYDFDTIHHSMRVRLSDILSRIVYV
jgi:hypothetical protein